MIEIFCKNSWWLKAVNYCPIKSSIKDQDLYHSKASFGLYSIKWCNNTPDKQNILIISLSAIAVTQVIFWTEDKSALFVIAGTHSAADSKS